MSRSSGSPGRSRLCPGPYARAPAALGRALSALRAGRSARRSGDQRRCPSGTRASSRPYRKGASAPRGVAEEALEVLDAGCPFLQLGAAGRGRGHDLRRDCPAITAAALDAVMAHEPAVVKKLLALARSIIEHGLVGRHRIIHRLSET